MYRAVQELLSVLITGPWICPMTVPQTHLARVSAKACHKWQSRAGNPDVPFPSSVPGQELAWAHGQRRKGQPAGITGWMRPSGDVTAPGATLLSEVIRIKLPVAKPALEASDRFTWAGSHSFRFHFTWHCTQKTCGAIGSFIPYPATSLGGECFRNYLR